MQKLVNVLATLSFSINAGIIGGGVYAYTQREVIIENAKAEVLASVKELLGTSQLGSALTEGVLPDAEVTDQDLGVDTNPPVKLPVAPF